MDFIKKINKFLQKGSRKNKLIIIYGPTGSGKTSLSIEIAKYLQTEIISTDSRQIFKYLNIGTGKVEFSVLHNIPHYMINFLEPNEEYSVGEFKKEAEKYLQEIYFKGKIPILCGGTGLYIDSLIYDFKIPKVPGNKVLREKLENERQEKGNKYIWQKLYDIDSKYAKELHSNNYRYVIRGIEVKTLTGKSKLDFKEEKNLKYDVLFLTPYDGDRVKLYDKINTRVQKMFDDGLVEEVKNLLEKYKKNDFGMKTIGYKEVIEYLEGKMNFEECVELVKKHNRNYAKRQLTWFKKYKN